MQFKIGRKLIGTLTDGTFHKEVLKSRHLFRVMDAWGVDSATLHKLPSTTKIEIHELEEDKWYKTTKEEFLRLGEQYLHFKNAEDFKTQLFLRRHHFRIENPPELTQEQKEENEYRISQGLSKKWL